MNIKGSLILLLSLVSIPAMAQSSALKEKAERQLNAFFLSYHPDKADFVRQPRMEDLEFDEGKKTVSIEMDSYFAQQDFTDKSVGKIYKKIKKALPKPYNKYKIRISTNSVAIEDLVPGSVSAEDTGMRMWKSIEYKGLPWVLNASKPWQPTHGLSNRHIALWASHGRYYDQDKGRWKWQRPNLFCTTEDLFTQTIVVPFLIPMLENAGATVFTPRERDWQTEEVVVDNDGSSNTSHYEEKTDRQPWVSTGVKGFAWHAGNYTDGENPFTQGTARMIISTRKRKHESLISWQPRISRGGRHAVYVSYQTVEGSVPDAEYIVMHKGQETRFHVNQQMGGGTWVYLGTFDFDAGCNENNRVILTNFSSEKGLVTADAVRFGGGMGNMERGGTVSGSPRCLEAARYYAQWAGAPYSVYSSKNGADDYADDINARSFMCNWLGGGSVYMPSLQGKRVPLELSLAVHSDAGYASNGKDLIGSLAICTTNFNDGRLNSGISRQASKDFASALLNGVTRDLTFTYKHWAKRYLWDRNYSETRCPEVPSAILETVSHQNFPDMKMAQDPNFRFTLARSIYKTIVRFVNGQHGRSAIIEPLPPMNFNVSLEGNKAKLSWVSQLDPQEPTATPTSYCVYVATGTNDFDNGTLTKRNSATIDLHPGIQYNFRVTAVNRGGESFPTPILSAVYEPHAKKTILVVNGFDRVSAPQVVDNATQQGFDLDADEGVSYGLTAGWNGKQICFDRSKMGHEGPGGLGYGEDELAGHFVMGNSFDGIRTHTEAIASTKQYNVVSCSASCIETGKVRMGDYQATDLILGLEKYSPDALKYYKTFPPQLQQQVKTYLEEGGRMLISGAYVGTDMRADTDAQWLSSTLHCAYETAVRSDSLGQMQGMGLQFNIVNTLNPDRYAAVHSDVLGATSPSAYCALQYGNGYSAAIAYNGSDYKTFTMGFPFETIQENDMRRKVMRGILDFLLK